MDTITTNVTFYYNELLDDIKQMGYVEGDIMKTEDEHDKHQVQDIGEAGNVDRVARVLGRCFAECVELCYPYAKVPVNSESGTMYNDDTLRKPESYVMSLTLPLTFSKTTVTLVQENIHEYLVCSVMADWTSITKPDAAAAWAAKAETARIAVHMSLNNRVGRIRRPLAPF